jgi:hypothetical protein
MSIGKDAEKREDTLVFLTDTNALRIITLLEEKNALLNVVLDVDLLDGLLSTKFGPSTDLTDATIFTDNWNLARYANLKHSVQDTPIN